MRPVGWILKDLSACNLLKLLILLYLLDNLVPKKGLEPPHPCEYVDLNHARLPIPPLRHGTQVQRFQAEQAASLSLANAACGVKFLSPEIGTPLARSLDPRFQHFNRFFKPHLPRL